MHEAFLNISYISFSKLYISFFCVKEIKPKFKLFGALKHQISRSFTKIAALRALTAR